MKVLSTSHLGFIVKDLNTIIKFYHGILGLKLLSGQVRNFMMLMKVRQWGLLEIM